MRDNKAFASLTSGLLARKGQARPAMRPQGFTQGMSQHDDLGWNDMGHDAPRVAGVRLPASLAGPQPVPQGLPSPAPVETAAERPEVLRQQDEIAREFVAPIEIAAEPALAGSELVETIAVATAVAEPVAAETAQTPTPVEPVSPAAVAPDPVVVAAPLRKPRAPRAAKPVAAPREAGRKAAFTLRLAADRHLMLRLACAVQHRSAQQIVTEALDRLLADLPDVARLAASLPRKD